METLEKSTKYTESKNSIIKAIFLSLVASAGITWLIKFILGIIQFMPFFYLRYKIYALIFGALYGAILGLYVARIKSKDFSHLDLKDLTGSYRNSIIIGAVAIGAFSYFAATSGTTDYQFISAILGFGVFLYTWSLGHLNLGKFHKITKEIKLDEGSNILLTYDFPKTCIFSGEVTDNVVSMNLNKASGRVMSKKQDTQYELGNIPLLPNHEEEYKNYEQYLSIVLWVPIVYGVFGLIANFSMSRIGEWPALLIFLGLVAAPLLRYACKVAMIPLFPSIKAFPTPIFQLRGTVAGQTLGLRVKVSAQNPKSLNFSFYNENAANDFGRLN